MAGKKSKIMRVVPRLANVNPLAGDPEDFMGPEDEADGKHAGDCIGEDCGEEATAGDLTLEDTGVEGKDRPGYEAGEMEVKPQLSAEKTKAVQAALSLLASEGVGHITLAGKKAQFFKVDPENPMGYKQVQDMVGRAYKGDLSRNDAFFFSVPDSAIPGGKIASEAKGQEMVAMSRELLASIVRNATEIGARNAVSVVFEQLSKAGYELRPRGRKQANLAETFGKKGKTNIQAEIEDGSTPTRGVVDGAEFDKAKPSDIDSLEFVANLPFDEFSTDKLVKGRKMQSREPNKAGG